jgi:hypothetical protein
LVTGTKDATLSVYSQKAGVKCDDSGIFGRGNPLLIQEGASSPAPNLKLTGSTQSITVSTPTQAGENLCLIADNGSPAPANKSVKVALPPAQISFAAKPVAGSNAISVRGDINASVGVLQFASNYAPNPKSENCSSTDLSNGLWLDIVLQQSTANNTVLSSSDPVTIALNKPLQAGTQLCLVALETPAGGIPTPYYSSFATVQEASTAQRPSFVDTPVGYLSKVDVKGAQGYNVEVYQFDVGYEPKDNSTCKDDVEHPGNHVHLLSINATSGSGSATAQPLPSPDSAGHSTLTLTSPLQPGWELCIVQVPPPSVGGATAGASAVATAPAAPPYSGFVTVTDPNSFPLGRAYYTAGAMVTNLNGSSGSSATAEYLDFGFLFAGTNENPHNKARYIPGFDGFLSARFSDVPVAASSTPTGGNSTSTGGTAPSSGSSSQGTLNILSTQESARIMGGMFLPFWTFRTNDHSDAYFVAPLAKAAFETLLNPAATANATNGSTGASTTSVAANFAPIYGYYAAGLRLGLRKYPTGDDPVPITLFQGDVTIGKYSNMQSFVCGPSTTFIAVNQPSTNTFCSVPVPPATSGGTVTYNIEAQDRRVLPRMEFEGFFNFLPSQFVLGIDANLTQSALSPRNLDILNKPGGSVSIFLGVSGNLLTLFTNHSIGGAGQ